MRTITIPWPDPNDEQIQGLAVVIPVMLDWFPPLTQEQVFQNAMAMLDGKEPPHEDRNLIHVRLDRTA